MFPLSHRYVPFPVVVSDLPARTSLMSGVVSLCFDDGWTLGVGSVAFPGLGRFVIRTFCMLCWIDKNRAF
jgi:hypothetical protein